MSLRDAAVALVAGLAVLGLVLVVVPGLSVGLPEQVLTLVGALGILLGAAVTYGWYDHEPTEATPAAREDPPRSSVPGADLDALLAEVPAAMTPEARHERTLIRREFEAVAVEALVRHRDCTESEAYRRLHEGTWTDDPHAAAFFVVNPYRSGASPGLVPSGADEQFRRGARHAAAELAAIAGVEGED